MKDDQVALGISVIVCAYTEDRWDAMGAAIDSLRAQSFPAGEIILAIDHNPRLFDRARGAFPDLVVVENSEERGLSGARNSGIAVARGDLLAFVDEDAVAAPDWLEQLCADYDDQAVVGVGGAIEPLWPAGRPRWFPEEFNWVVGCTYLGIAQGSAPVRNLIGCNMSFRREVFEAVGGFRSGIGRVGTRPVGCEETELCIRVRQYWPERILLYKPAALVHHRVPEGRARPSYFRARCYAEGLSKALVARLVGADDGLSSERAYTMRTLPRGLGRGLRDTLLHGDFAGLARAGAILAGLAVTTAGYLAGTIHGEEMAEDKHDRKRREPKSNRAACDRFHAD